MNAHVDITGVVLSTDRLILRPWKESDVEDFYEYARVDGVGQMAGWMPHKSVEKSREILRMFIEEKKTFAVVLRESGKVIGSVGIEEIRNDLPGELTERWGREIGYVLSKDYWGRGLMPEAVKAVIGYCFRDCGMDYLLCGHFVWNNQSRRVIEKCGFTHILDCKFETRDHKVEDEKLYLLKNPEK